MYVCLFLNKVKLLDAHLCLVRVSVLSLSLIHVSQLQHLVLIQAPERPLCNTQYQHPTERRYTYCEQNISLKLATTRNISSNSGYRKPSKGTRRPCRLKDFLLRSRSQQRKHSFYKKTFPGSEFRTPFMSTINKIYHLKQERCFEPRAPLWWHWIGTKWKITR